MAVRVPSSETISGELENNTEDPNRPHPKLMKRTGTPSRRTRGTCTDDGQSPHRHHLELLPNDIDCWVIIILPFHIFLVFVTFVPVALLSAPAFTSIALIPPIGLAISDISTAAVTSLCTVVFPYTAAMSLVFRRVPRSSRNTVTPFSLSVFGSGRIPLLSPPGLMNPRFATRSPPPFMFR